MTQRMDNEPEVLLRQYEVAAHFPFVELLGFDGWPDSVLKACSEVCQERGISPGQMEQYYMPGWRC